MIRALMLGCCSAAAVVGTMTFAGPLISQAAERSQESIDGSAGLRSVKTQLLPIPVLRAGQLNEILFLRVAILFQGSASTLSNQVVEGILTDAAYHYVMTAKADNAEEATLSLASLRKGVSAALKPRLDVAGQILIDQMNVRSVQDVR